MLSFAAEDILACKICQKLLIDPRTLPCLHSFCLHCLEDQVNKASTTSPSNSLCCEQCKAPFNPPSLGLKSLECSPFISSLSKSSTALVAPPVDVNAEIRCVCNQEDAIRYCTECKRYLGPACSASHNLFEATAAHHQISVEESFSGNRQGRSSRCQIHPDLVIDTYCETCNKSLCSRCIIEKHSKHDFGPLEKRVEALQDKIVNLTVTSIDREQGAERAISTLEGTVRQIEDCLTATEIEISRVFDLVVASVEHRRTQMIGEMHNKRDQLRKTAMREKGEAESACFEFREFRSFTEGFLAEATPNELEESHKKVSLLFACLFVFPRWTSIFFFFFFLLG